MEMTDNEKLIEIIKTKDISELKTWLENGGNPDILVANHHMLLADPDCKGNPLLMWVVREIDEPDDDQPIVEMIDLLIKYGADVNATAFEDVYTNLCWVVSNSRTVIARMLLDAGADTNFRSDTGDTLLVDAMERECFEMVALLLQYSSLEAINMWGGIWSNTPLGMAFRTVNVPMIELLLSYGADPDAYDPDQMVTINNLPYVRDDATRQKIETLIEKYK
jgi:ankyrin repeat protein